MEDKLYVVGIGPGAYDLLTIRAERVLKKVDEIVGYKTYVRLIRPFFPEKVFKEFGMGEEMKRIEYAVNTVQSGKDVALISGGDPTIYGMVSPLVEYLVVHNIYLNFDVIPGVTSMVAASPLIGAPLGNDFAVLSLSDYLVNWEKIVSRLEAMLLSGITVVLYNPVSKGKEEKVDTIKRLIMKIRGENTLLGIVKNAEREGEEKLIIPVKRLSPDILSMRSIIFVSGEDVVYRNNYFFALRGYNRKGSLDLE